MSNKKKIIDLSSFTNVANLNGYEIFTQEEVSKMVQDNLTKSIKNELSEECKEEFVASLLSFSKAICTNNANEDVTVYYRKAPMNISVECYDDNLIKSVACNFTETLENTRLKRVGESFDITNDIFDQIEKSDKPEPPTHRYKDNELNRRMHRVGLPYTPDEESESDGSSKKGSKFSEGMSVEVKLKNGVVQGTVRKIEGNKMSVSMKDGSTKVFSLEAAGAAIKKK